MHGSRPLPDGKHTFPASPDVYKFWGTPLSKNYFKFLGYYIAYSTFIVGLNFYLTRNEPGEFGYVSLRPVEELKGIINIREVNSALDDLDLGIHQRHRDMLGFNKDPHKPNIVFDDGIDYVPPSHIRPKHVASG